MKIIFRYFAVLVPLVALDAVWIGFIARPYYGRELGFLLMPSPHAGPIIAFYPLYALAVLLLAVSPAIAMRSFPGALWRGALLGCAAYAAYDLTNQATIAGWPIGVTFVDIAWGAFMTAAASGIAYTIISSRR